MNFGRHCVVFDLSVLFLPFSYLVVIYFLFLDDIKTIFNPKASSVSKSLAIIALFPAGKIVKGAKAFKLLEKYGKSSLAEATARYGSSKVLGSTSKGILLEGNSKRGWKHIYTSHVTKTQGKSTFPGHLSTKQIKDKIYYTLNHGKVVHATNSGNITYS